jgi:TolB-like protein
MKIWKELRRRRVFRLAGIYILGAWVVLQVADISFPAWGVPDSALRYLFIAAFACFPVALIFSWFYDITPGGIVRTEKAEDAGPVDLKLRRADYFILAALLAIGLVILVGSASKIQEEIGSGSETGRQVTAPENSIAVLPFTNLDINPETGHFSDGITEEILDRLSSLKSLHVLASTSSFAFRDSGKSLDDILTALGVRYLLQGSIRREGDHIRVTARLIGESGFQVWSEQFERELKGIFAIQTEIASTVASQIVNEIVPLAELPEGRTTANMHAYNEYLAGKAYMEGRTSNWVERATASFRKAIDLDPGFAPPYAALAMAITVNTSLGPHWDEGRQLAEEAISLDGELAEGHAALGLIHMAEGNLHEAARSSRRAIELNPSLGFAYNILANALNRLGQADEALTTRRKGLAVDPLNPPLVANMAGSEIRAGNPDRAEQLYGRLLSLPEPPSLAYGGLYNLFDATGRFTDAVAIAKAALRQLAPSGDLTGLDWLAWAYGNLGMIEDADYWMSRALSNGKVNLATLDLTYNVLRMRAADSELGASLLQLVDETEYSLDEHGPWTMAQFGLVNIYMGRLETGAEQLDYGLRLYQAYTNQSELADSIDISILRAGQEDVVWVMHMLAFAHQQIGQHDEADGILQALTDQFGLDNNALHYALSGDSENALRSMQAMQESGLAKYYGPGKYYAIINDPVWADTIQAPGFQVLLAEMKDKLDRQRAVVEAIDAEHDFRVEIEQLVPR